MTLGFTNLRLRYSETCVSVMLRLFSFGVSKNIARLHESQMSMKGEQVNLQCSLFAGIQVDTEPSMQAMWQRHARLSPADLSAGIGSRARAIDIKDPPLFASGYNS